MLVLTRKIEEVIVIGEDNALVHRIKITVLGIEKGRVRLGFEAAENVRVHRLEVWKRINRGL